MIPNANCLFTVNNINSDHTKLKMVDFVKPYKNEQKLYRTQAILETSQRNASTSSGVSGIFLPKRRAPVSVIR